MVAAALSKIRGPQQLVNPLIVLGVLLLSFGVLCTAGLIVLAVKERGARARPRYQTAEPVGARPWSGKPIHKGAP